MSTHNSIQPSTEFNIAPEWMTLIGKSEQGGRDYVPCVEGSLPEGLTGSLYRNGPGLFERGGRVINHALDGDGLIQRLSFDDSGVRYQNEFVRTEKFTMEAAANKRLHSTWTTRKSNFLLRNLGGGVSLSQAGVTVYPINGRLLARDEIGESYQIDPESLATMDQLPLPAGLEGVGFKAHSKLDPDTGDWIMAGTKYGRSTEIHTAIYDKDFGLKSSFSFESPRSVYIHDFIVTKNYLVFVLHPCMFSPFPFLLGLKSFTDSFEWKAKEGNLIAVISRNGGKPNFFEAPGAFMWHALNAYESKQSIVADLVAYDDPDHFIGDAPLLKTLMRGEMGRAQVPGTVRRYQIDFVSNKLTEEVLDTENHEFPMMDERLVMSRQKFGYFAWSGLAAFNSGLKRLNYETGRADKFDFGSDVHVGEPVFVAKPSAKTDQGWLLAQCLDGHSGKTFFAVFDAQSIDSGPVAKVWLEHHVPISFHGAWQALNAI